MSERDYANRVLVLQGGGALGSYQAGVFEGLAGAGIAIDWVAGISIGALNAALIAGNAPEHRVERLTAFWNEVCRQPLLPPLPGDAWPVPLERLPRPLREWLALVQSSRAVFEGQRGFFVPRLTPLPWLAGMATPGTASYYDTAPLRATLERFVDIDRVNHPGGMRVSVSAVNVRTGDLAHFDNRDRALRLEHFLASAALPPSFPAVEIDGEFYWDAGIVMNTPLIHVLQSEPRHDTLVFQVDLWSAHGPLPTSMSEVEERKKDVLFSSRTRVVNQYMRELQTYRKCIADLLALVPEDQRTGAVAQQAAELACDRRCNVQQLICADSRIEGSAKDYEFGRATMRRHWQSGQADIAAALARPDRLAMPSAREPFEVHVTRRDHPVPVLPAPFLSVPKRVAADWAGQAAPATTEAPAHE